MSSLAEDLALTRRVLGVDVAVPACAEDLAFWRKQEAEMEMVGRQAAEQRRRDAQFGTVAQLIEFLRSAPLDALVFFDSGSWDGKGYWSGQAEVGRSAEYDRATVDLRRRDDWAGGKP